MSTEITFSSDTTSHKNIDYECRTLVAQVVNYEDPLAEPVWVQRTMGIDISVNHTASGSNASTPRFRRRHCGHRALSTNKDNQLTYRVTLQNISTN